MVFNNTEEAATKTRLFLLIFCVDWITLNGKEDSPNYYVNDLITSGL